MNICFMKTYSSFEFIEKNEELFKFLYSKKELCFKSYSGLRCEYINKKEGYRLMKITFTQAIFDRITHTSCAFNVYEDRGNKNVVKIQECKL